MSYLILKTPSKEYASAISHELWMLARPRGISDNETSQFFCGVYEHPKNKQVAIGPLDGNHPIHTTANEELFTEIITDAITVNEKASFNGAIHSSKGGSIGIMSLLGASPSLSNNLRTREQLEKQGWFPDEEL